MTNVSILLLPGDGIGPEAIAELTRVINWFGDNTELSFDITTDDVGGAAYDRYGTPLADSTLDTAYTLASLGVSKPHLMADAAGWIHKSTSKMSILARNRHTGRQRLRRHNA